MKKYFELDKIAHFLVCFAIAILVAAVDVKIWHRPLAVAAAIGWFTAFFVGICKEAVDFFRGGKFDFHDLVADAAGAAVGAISVAIIA